MRELGAVVMIAGMVWLLVGCGGAVAPLMGGMKSGVTLSDQGSGTLYRLSVADGALVLTESANAQSAGPAAGLTDGVTGASYQVGVSGGALTLRPGAGATASQIGLADTVTAQTYELAVTSGALTLTADGDE